MSSGARLFLLAGIATLFAVIQSATATAANGSDAGGNSADAGTVTVDGHGSATPAGDAAPDPDPSGATTGVAALPHPDDAAALASDSTASDLPAAASLAIAVTPESAVAPVLANPIAAPVVASTGLLASPEEQKRATEEKLAAELAEKEARRAEERAQKAHEAAVLAARRAHTVAERAIASGVAEIEAARVHAAGVGRELARIRADAARLAHQRITAESDFYSRATDKSMLGEAVVELYREVDRALVSAHREMSRAFAADPESTRLKPLRLKAPPRPSDPRLAAGYEKLNQSLKRLRDQRSQLRRIEKRIAQGRLTDSARTVLRLGRIRSLVIERMASTDREALAGFGHAGLRAARRELNHTRLVLLWTPTAWRRMLSTSDEAGDADLGSTTFAIGELLVLLILYLVARQRWRPWLAAVAPVLNTEVHNLALRQLMVALLRVFGALGGELILLFFVHAVGNLLVDDSTPPELAALYAVIVTYAWYRLILQAAHRYLRSAAQMRGVELSDRAEARIIWSLRLAGRYSFAVVAAVVFIDHVVGAGFLATWIRRAFWGGFAIIVFMLLRRWRTSITSSYVKHFPQGRLADLVRATKGRSAGTIVALAAFGYVAVRGITLYLRDVAMRFEHTRRALAYLFRRRLERHADKLGTGETKLTDLPERVVLAFSEPCARGIELVEGMPGLEDALHAVRLWLDGDTAPDMLVTGPHGGGRTTWLDAVEARATALVTAPDELQITRIEVQRRITSEAAICRLVCGALELPESTRAEEIIKQLREGPKRLILLDDAQMMVLRSMDGLAGLRCLAELVVGSMENVMWVCTCTTPAWRFATSVMRGRNVFTRVIDIGSWSEERIRDLVRGRMEWAGADVRYNDLVIDQLEAGLSEGLRAAERFHRMLWDQADGNPREAMRLWLRSLIPGENGVLRVRLFNAADPDQLEELGELSRFVLAAIVQHDYLTVDEAARVLNEPARDCRMTLTWLASRAYVRAENGRYEVTGDWRSAALRYLRRKHLAYD